MKLTRKHELKLIDLGLNFLINEFDVNQLIGKRVTVKKPAVKKAIEKKGAKRLHWTQTAKGKAKMAKQMKKMWRDKRKNNV